LDSLVRIETYQWVTRENAESFFLATFSPELAAGEEELAGLRADAQNCSYGKLNSISDFLQ
jgi:hypothetical protein